MCGIAAVRTHRGPGTPWLTRLLDRIAHRGAARTRHESAADRGGRWLLGTNRLPIVAPEHGRQPTPSPDGRLLVVFNGEVFNHRELAAALPAGRLTGPERACDTRVLAAALAEWGPAATVERLVWEGAFLAVEQHTGRVWTGRDHLGVKPLYRAAFHGGVAFASEIKALVDLPGCARVHPVPPGTVESYDERGVRLRALRWWEVGGRAVRPTPVADARRELLGALREAVHRRVPDEGRFAVALSGGLDSAAVLRLAVETGRVPHAYVLYRPGSPDLEYARGLCRALDVPLTEVPGLDPDQLRDQLPSVIATLETWEWQVVNHAAPMLPLTAAIHADGHRVVLSGEGADELFLGYPRPVAPAAAGAGDPVAARDEQRERVAALHRTNCRRLDRMGMRHQLEFRVPFLDRTVAEWALRTPADLLVRDGVGKWVLREALRDLLPPGIVDRPKLAMARGAGYRYSATTTPTVFGDLPAVAEPAAGPLARLARYPAERVFLDQFVRCGYAKAEYVLSHSP